MKKLMFSSLILLSTLLSADTFSNSFMGIRSCIEEGEMEDCDHSKYGKRKETVAIAFEGKIYDLNYENIDKKLIDDNIFKRNLEITGKLNGETVTVENIKYIQPVEQKADKGGKKGCK